MYLDNHAIIIPRAKYYLALSNLIMTVCRCVILMLGCGHMREHVVKCLSFPISNPSQL